MTRNRLALFAFGAALCAAATTATAGDGKAITQLISADSQVVVVFDVADARDSALLKKGYQTILAAQPDAQKKMAELGIDPVADIDTIMVAGGGVKKLDELGQATSVVVIFEGRLPKTKLATLSGVTKSKYLGVDIWTKEDTDAAFIGKRLFLAKRGQMKSTIELVLKKGKGKGNTAATSKAAADLRAAIKGTDTAADLWMTVLIPEQDRTTMAKEGVIFTSVGAGVNFGADVKIGLGINATDDAGAKKAVDMIQGMMGQLTGGLHQVGLSEAAKTMAVSQDKTAVRFAVTLTEAEIDTLVNLIASASNPPAVPAAESPSTMAPSTTAKPSGKTTAPKAPVSGTKSTTPTTPAKPAKTP